MLPRVLLLISCVMKQINCFPVRERTFACFKHFCDIQVLRWSRCLFNYTHQFLKQQISIFFFFKFIEIIYHSRLGNETLKYYRFLWNSQSVVPYYGEKPWETCRRPSASVSQGFPPLIPWNSSLTGPFKAMEKVYINWLDSRATCILSVLRIVFLSDWYTFGIGAVTTCFNDLGLSRLGCCFVLL